MLPSLSSVAVAGIADLLKRVPDTRADMLDDRGLVELGHVIFALMHGSLLIFRNWVQDSLTLWPGADRMSLPSFNGRLVLIMRIDIHIASLVLLVKCGYQVGHAIYA